MARAKKNDAALTLEEKLEQALVPDWEWPYKLPSNWRWTKAGYLVKLYRGVSYNKNDAHTEKRENDCLIMRGGNILEGELNIDADNVYVDKQLVTKEQFIQKSDIIIVSSTGSKKVIGRAGIAMSDYDDIAFGAFLTLLRPLDFVSKKFVGYYFQSDLYRERVRSLAGGVNINNIRAEHITDAPFPLPPITEQQRIVDRIESLFAKLDEAKEKAQATLDSFETRKAAILHKAFNGELIDKKDVNTVLLETIVDTIRIGPFGSALHQEDYISNGIPVINPKHIVGQQIKEEDRVTVSLEKASELSAYVLRENDIILGRRGEMGRSAPVGRRQEGWICGTGSMIIRLKTGYDASFYSQIIGSQSVVQYLEENSVGSTLKNLNEKIVRYIPIPDFSVGEQKKLVKILESLLEKEQQANELAENVLSQIDLMKRAILSRAFRGELGTNDPNEESALELLKSILADKKQETPDKPSKRRIVIPDEVAALLSSNLEKELIKVFYKEDRVLVPMSKLMAVSSKKFEVISAIKKLQQKGIIEKTNNGDFKLMR